MEIKTLLEYLKEWFLTSFPGRDKPSPKDRIKPEQIVKLPTTMCVQGIGDVKNDIWITSLANTHSMDPWMDTGSDAILKRVTDVNDLQVGDVIVYERGGPNDIVIHQIIKTDNDGAWYCIPKGINNVWQDGKVRAAQVKWVMIGIFY